ncbi:MAG: sugar diacid recognition domain-containing protein [Clostridiales bacterium]|nr:sugar diacid recognition domain-containing protein [Clostridiales bacterium]
MERKISKTLAQQIVETVKDVCGQDVNFIDKNGYIFASTNPKRVQDYHEIGKRVIDSGTLIEVISDNSFLGTQRGVNIPFSYNGEVIAAIGISGVPEKVRKYAYLAQKITSLLLREHELDTQNHNQKAKLNYIIHSLITHEHISSQYFSEFMEKYQISEETMYQTILVKIDKHSNPSNIASLEQQIFQIFDTIGSPLYTFQYPNEYIMLLDSKQLSKWTYLLEKLANNHKKYIRIGVGKVDTLLRQYNSYEAAKLAIHSLAKPDNLAYFEQLDLEILLGSVTNEAKEFFLNRTIASLSKKDCDLLRTYFACDMSLKATCDTLFLHKNTLQYQLDKIWHTCGYNPRSFRDAAILYMALKF